MWFVKKINTYRNFLISFLITLLAWATLCALWSIDRSARSGGFGSASDQISLSAPDPLTLVVRTGHYEFELDLTTLNQLERLRRHVAVYTTPRWLRLTRYWTSAVIHRIHDAEEQRREREYYQNAGLV